ncbi:MAG: hypothetical protein J1E62_04800 [Lachnospiraceae bacterium]|nr:hypothetical protein [Lachnospiraceae bacterium]
MRVWKKVLSGVSVGICSLALAAIVGGASVDAASLAVSAFTVDYDKQQLTIKDTTQKEFYVSIPTVTTKVDKTTQETVTTVTAKAWDIYDAPAGIAIVDLSFIKPAKEAYIMIKGSGPDTAAKVVSKEDPVMIHFEPSATGVKPVYDAVNDTVSFTDAKKNPIEGKKFQFRSEYGTWADYGATVSLKEHAQQGTTVYFREKYEDATTKQAKAFSAALNPASVVGGYTTFAASHFAGAEAKIKITKLANGPSVKVDYVNKTFTVPIGSEYRFNYATSWKAVATDETGKKPVPVQLSEIAAKTGAVDAGILEARVAADTVKNKAASRFTQAKFNAVVHPNAGTVASGKITALTDTTAVKTDVQNVAVGATAATQELCFAYDYNEKTGAYTNLVATNLSTEKSFQIVVSDDYVKLADVASLNSAKVIATVKAAASLEKPTVTKIAVKNVSGKYIYVRYMADAKKQVWSSDYKSAGKADLPNVK